MRTHQLPPAAGPPVQAEELLAGVARGEHAAFEALYERMSAPVHGVIRRVLRDPAQSEEVTQEVLLQVWRTAARYDRTRGSAMAWVMTIAHRRAVDRVRAEQCVSDYQARLAGRDIDTDYDCVAEDVQTRLDRDAVRACLTTLTDLQHQAITLAYYAGHTYLEVADVLAVPPGTAKSRIRDGLIRLRDCLGVAD